MGELPSSAFGRIQDTRDVEMGIPTLEKDLLLRAHDKHLPILPKDRGVIETVIERLDAKQPNRIEYHSALVSLSFLTPRVDEATGRIVIGNSEITPARADRMRSRESAKEYDLADHPFMRFPSPVREYILTHSQLQAEATDRCTVGCNYCGVGKKGPITNKFSYEGLIKLMELFAKYDRRNSFFANHFPRLLQAKGDVDDFSAATRLIDMAFWNTDILDPVWFDPHMNWNKDYMDILSEYQKIMQHKKRVLYSSTSIPFGRELAALNFAMAIVDGDYMFHDHLSQSLYRISLNNHNRETVEAICNIGESLYGDDFSEHVAISPNRDELPLVAGNKWAHVAEQIRWADIVGISCVEQVNFTPTGIHSVIMVGSSKERPEGEEYPSIERIGKDGKKVYYVPRYGTRPNQAYLPVSLYPDTVYAVFKEGPRGIWTKSEETDTQNPHKALLRVAGTILRTLDRDELYREVGAPIPRLSLPSVKTWLKQTDINQIQDHLNSGHENPSMSLVLTALQDSHVIDEHGILLRL